MISFLQISAIEALKPRWDDLFRATGSENPFLSWDWVQRWDAHTNRSDRTYIGICERDERLTALICFRVSRHALELYSDSDYADYAGALCRPGHEKDIVAMLKEMFKRFSPMAEVFRPIRSLDAISRALDAYFSNRKHPWRRSEFAVNPIVRILGDFDQYYIGRDKRLRQEIRTTENRLNAMGGWDFAIGVTKADRDLMYSQLVEFHIGRQAGKVGRSIFHNRKSRDFFRALLHQDGMAFSAQMSALRVGARIVSAAYVLRCDRTVFYWIPSFDMTIRSVSLGKLHVKCLIEHCHRSGLECFDFMGGDEPYKYEWANETYAIYDYRGFRNSLLAVANDVEVGLRTHLKSLAVKYAGIRELWRRASKFVR